MLSTVRSELAHDRPKTPGDRLRLRAELLRMAERTYAKLEAQGRKRDAAIWHTAINKLLVGNWAYLGALLRAKHLPVTIDEFLQSKEFWKDQMDLWPTLTPDIKALCPDVLAGEKHNSLALLGGATGTGKTAFGHTVNAYHLYCFTCFKDPQRLFDLPVSTPIIFAFAAVSVGITKRVIFRPFREMFLNMPYAKSWVSFDKNIESELHLDGNIQVVPILASVNAIVGQAIAGGIVDEINFMAHIENSKQVAGATGQGGTYDQAELIYSNIKRRRKSRFITDGPSWGVLSISSSTRYKGDFLDREMDFIESDRISASAEGREDQNDAVLIRRKQYEMQPKFALKPDYPRFRFLVGTDAYPGRVLKDHEEAGVNYPEEATVELVPIDYKPEAERDPGGFSRDVIGVASLSISPFIQLRHKIMQSMLRGLGVGADDVPDELPEPQHWVEKVDVDLAEDGMPQWNDELLRSMPESIKKSPWFIHVDLSINGDTCGVAGSRVREYRDVLVGKGEDATVETLPVFDVGFTVGIKPSALKEIDPAEIRRFILLLKTVYGFNIYMVTYDGFQSAESVRVLNSAGVRSEVVSMDRTTEPAVYFRRALYEDRVDLTHHDALRIELVSLEHDKKKDKVDHPPRGSKDIADAVIGSIYAAGKSRVVRTSVGAKVGEEKADMRTRPRQVERPKSVVRPRSRFRPNVVPEKPKPKTMVGKHPDDPEQDEED